jgi:hypothetical protein
VDGSGAAAIASIITIGIGLDCGNAGERWLERIAVS